MKVDYNLIYISSNKTFWTLLLGEKINKLFLLENASNLTQVFYDFSNNNFFQNHKNSFVKLNVFLRGFV